MSTTRQKTVPVALFSRLLIAGVESGRWATNRLVFTAFLLLAVLAAAIAQPNGLVSELPARCIGPAMPKSNGRVVGIAVYAKAPSLFFLASASGGVWKTENAGATFTPVFDREGSSSVGCVSVSQSNPNLVWVGTGEATRRNDAGWGDGVYKSTDGGKTWQNMGLRDSFSIGKITIDPKNNDIVYVAALGSAWGYGAQRGVFKTVDGGKNWKRTLFVDEQTGAADLVMDPGNPRNLLAAMWQNLRKPYSFTSGGPSCGLYRSSDAGTSWHLASGLPKTVGRIGLSYFEKDTRIVDAIVEAKGKEGGVYRSKDGGQTWMKTRSRLLNEKGTVIEGNNPVTHEPQNSLDDRPFYFSLIRQDPQDANRIYLGTEDLKYSTDGGSSFRSLGYGAHADYHDLWIDPMNGKHWLAAEDGGAVETWDSGRSWRTFTSNLALGQVYRISFDTRSPYWVYGSLQDNGCFCTATEAASEGVTSQDTFSVFGGDGTQVQVDPEDWRTIYAESQCGFLGRIDLLRHETRTALPHTANNAQLRRNWCTPVAVSPWNSHTLYYGANILLKSVDRGDTWQAISPDLTKNNPEWQRQNEGITPDFSGAETYDSIVTICESPLKQGLIWVGTDDGNVQVTKDAGANWIDVTPNIRGLPRDTWVSRVTASRYSEGRVYVTFDGHRNNDFTSYIFVSEDYGKTWSKLNDRLLPRESCYVIIEGLRNPDLLFLGTEFSLYVSLDRGQTWTRYRRDGFPTVSVYDLAIQPNEEDLVIGTHGRSVWILPVGALEELTKQNLGRDVYFAHPANIYLLGMVRDAHENRDSAWFSSNTQPGTLFCYYLKKGAGKATITVTDPSGRVNVLELSAVANSGLNVVPWKDTRWNPAYSNHAAINVAGDYRVVLKVNGSEYAETLHVAEAPYDQP